MTRDELVISTADLEERLDDPQVRVVDLRFALDDPEQGRRAFAEARIPGAVYLHWLDDLSDPDDPVAGQLAPPERFREAMELAGIGDATLVVAYDDGIIFMAARLVWCLRVHGHDRVRILDGGLPRWKTEGRALETGVPQQAVPAVFTPKARPGLRLTKDDVRRALEEGDAVVLDCRMDETWDAVGEHIPGARRLPAPSLVDLEGRLLPAAELGARARAAGAGPDDRVVLYCGGGVSASLAYGALQTAGYGDVAVYDGSWAEWSLDPGLPRARH